MNRWAKIVVSGVLATVFVATPAKAGPRHGRVELYSPSSAPDQVNGRSNASFAGKLPIRELIEEEAILHVLNRLGFGPRPGQVEQIEKTGLENWIQAQLHPENISDPVVDARLAQFPALGLGAAGLLDKYPPQDVAAKSMGLKVDEYQKNFQDLAQHP